MANEKEDLKDQLQSIKDNLEKKLSGKEVDIEKESKKEKVTDNKAKIKKPISIKVGMEVVTDEKKVVNKNQKSSKSLKTSKPVKPIPVSNTSNNKTKKELPKKKKKKRIVPILFLLILLGSLFYVFQLKKDLQQEKSKFEEEKKGDIDYNKDTYFKEVEDEVDDEEMQDFAIYKDVPEIVVKSNTKSETLSDIDTKNIDKQISERQVDNEKQANNKRQVNKVITQKQQVKSKTTTEKVKNSDQVVNNSSQTIAKEIKKTKAEERIPEKREIKKDEVFSDMIKVVGLQHNDGSFALPKKAKKTNAFKVRVRLKKNQISKSDLDTNIMLVVKNASGSTIKIDSKKVNFGKQNSKVLNLEFYEIFPERLKTNTSYSFSVFANKKLIKSYRKSI